VAARKNFFKGDKPDSLNCFHSAKRLVERTGRFSFSTRWIEFSLGANRPEVGESIPKPRRCRRLVEAERAKTQEVLLVASIATNLGSLKITSGIPSSVGRKLGMVLTKIETVLLCGQIVKFVEL